MKTDKYGVGAKYVYSTSMNRGKADIVLTKGYGGVAIIPDMTEYDTGDVVEIFGIEYVLQSKHEQWFPVMEVASYHFQGYSNKTADEVFQTWKHWAEEIEIKVTKGYL